MGNANNPMDYHKDGVIYTEHCFEHVWKKYNFPEIWFKRPFRVAPMNSLGSQTKKVEELYYKNRAFVYYRSILTSVETKKYLGVRNTIYVYGACHTKFNDLWIQDGWVCWVE